MSMRRPAGFISAFYDPLKNPDAPTIGTATGGDTSASVAFTAPSNVGGSAISSYGAISNPENIVATGASSPISVTGLTNGTSYTFQVWAINTYGPSAYSAASGSVTPSAPRGLFAGGNGNDDYISYINIASLGNATYFGTLITQSANEKGACSSSTRAVMAVGADDSKSTCYVTIATTGNATYFGDLTFNGRRYSSASNETRGLWFGGVNNDTGGYLTNIIQYVTIASTGNASDFGDLIQAREQLTSFASPTRAVAAGGYNAGYKVTMDYITIASTGNATSFGNLTVAASNVASCSSNTRGIVGGGVAIGGTNTNVISYVTTATTGNATDFGDLLSATSAMAGTSSQTRGVFAGGYISAATNVIQYITIASTGNATDFGDLTAPTYAPAGCSSAHGGL